MSNPEFFPRGFLTSTVSVNRRAAEAVGEYATRLLRDDAFVNVTGVPLERNDPLSFGHGTLEIELPVMATSLRWREGGPTYPGEIIEGFPLLTCYDFSRDIYLGFIALPSFDFKVSSRLPEW